MTDWWMIVDQMDWVVASVAMVLGSASVGSWWRLSRMQSASTKHSVRALEECQEAHRLAVAALDVSNELRTEVAELRKLGVRQPDDQRRRAELGALIRRERLEAETSGGASAWSFRVENQGASAARNMKLLVDGRPAHEHPSIFAPIQEPTALGAQDFIEYPLAVPLLPEQRRPLNVRITWDDDSRTHRIDEFVLTAE